ncbi:MAG: aldo/keto reductase [Fusobacteriaceae bacterium]
MKRVKLSQKLEVSKVALGFWRLDSWNMSSEELIEYLEKSIQLGVTTFDHADIYGSYTCEKIFGDAMVLKPELREKIELVTKVGIKLVSENKPENTYHCYDTSYEHIMKSVEKSADSIVYSWHFGHPANCIPVCGSGKIERLKSAIAGLDIKLEREEWFEILQKGMGIDIP